MVYVLVVNVDASCTIGIATYNFGVLFTVPNIFYVMYMYMHTCFIQWNCYVYVYAYAYLLDTVLFELVGLE